MVKKKPKRGGRKHPVTRSEHPSPPNGEPPWQKKTSVGDKTPPSVVKKPLGRFFHLDWAFFFSPTVCWTVVSHVFVETHELSCHRFVATEPYCHHMCCIEVTQKWHAHGLHLTILQRGNRECRAAHSLQLRLVHTIHNLATHTTICHLDPLL